MSSKIVTILWRDIPAQVMAREGRNVHRINLPGRFQQAIDRAAMEAGLIGTDDYLEEWRQEEVAGDRDLESDAAQAAELIEARFSVEMLNAYAANGGVAPTGEEPHS